MIFDVPPLTVTSRKGLNSKDATKAVKLYKSHGRVGTVAEVQAAMAKQEARKALLH
jgi:hypothetical protein